MALPMSLEKKDKVIIEPDKFKALFQWRDNNKDLVRKFSPLLSDVVIHLIPEKKGDYETVIHVEPSEFYPLYHHKFTHYLSGVRTVVMHFNRNTQHVQFDHKELPGWITRVVNDKTLEMDYINSILSTYCSLMAYMEHHREVIIKTDVSRQQVKKKSKKGKQKNKVTYIRNIVYKFDGVMATAPEKRSYTPPTDPYKVRGHWKNVACGKGRMERKRVWVPGYTKNEQDGKQPEAKTYKV
jgi:hypothetical protein